MNPATVKNLQQPCDTLVLTFIPGGDGQLRHYEDDGMSQQYKTNYAVTTVSKKQEGNTVRVRISPREVRLRARPTTAATNCASRPSSRPSL